ncbi:hypothetical protein [Nocardiopsis lucentensis]|uniref:hypothetical protein n=1 Tax=Nocardiopsis lucentensis TaxID=53441 RepID=UPI00036F4DE2|nr:hypothetical protein [Nocardiopsis lucentensis]
MPTRTRPSRATTVTLVVGGLVYVLFLLLALGYLRLSVVLGLLYRGSTDGLPTALWIVFLLGVSFFAVLVSALQRARVPRPVATVALLTAVVLLGYLQWWFTVPDLTPSSLFDGPTTGLGVLAAAAAVLGILAAAPKRAFLWALVAVVAVTALRAGVDWRLRVERERERFDALATEISEYPDEMVLLAAEGWTPVSASVRHDDSGVSVGYQDADGREVRVTSNASPGSADSDTEGSEHAAPLDCDGAADPALVDCEELDGVGVGASLLLTWESFHEEFHSIRLEWETGTVVEVAAPLRDGSVHAGDDAYEPSEVTTDELRALAGRLRVAEDGEALALTERITGGPRP